MRIAYFLLALLLAGQTGFGQTHTETIALEDETFSNYFLKRDVPVVKGKIKNLSKKDIDKFQIEYPIVTPFQKLQVKKTCALNADGSFVLKLDYALPHQQLWIEFDSLFYTGVYADTDLFIELDAAVLKTQTEPAFNAPGVSYLGRDGALNKYINDHVLFERETQLEIGSKADNSVRVDKRGFDEFIKTYDSLYAILNGVDDEYIKRNGDVFAWVLKNERRSSYLAGLILRHWGGKQMPPALFEKMNAHKAYLTTNEGMLFYSYFFTYLKHIALAKINAGGVRHTSETITDAVTIETLRIIDSLFSPSKADFFKIKFGSSDLKEQKMNLETVLPTIKTAWCKNVLNAEYNKTLDNLAAINKILDQANPVDSPDPLGKPIGELPFGATLYQIGDIKGDSLLFMLKSAFKNKALYIDFWATWCSPCLAEFPHSKRLSDESKDLPVEFIYLCTSDGSDTEKWKLKIAEYKLSGHHFFVEKSVLSNLMGLLSFSGYPSYLLINTKGRKADMPGRPSDLDRGKLAELIK